MTIIDLANLFETGIVFLACLFLIITQNKTVSSTLFILYLKRMAVEKEKLSSKEGGDQAIETRLIDVEEKRAKVPVPREVESWMEKIEKVPTVGDGKVKVGQKNSIEAS